ncbi:MAG: acyltransferase [Methylotenera sp.]|nr:acyltransferase [Methylotenera sp.]
MLNKLLLIHRYPYYIRKLLEYRVLKYFVGLAGAKVSKRVRFYGMPIISMHKNSEIVIGESCVLCSRSDMTDLGVNHQVVLRTLRSGASIVIGNDTGISGGAICAAIRVEIGNECLIGANVTISDTDFHAISPIGRRYNQNPQDIAAAQIIIEDNVFIGTGSIVLKGVRIGKNSVVGAGSVVTKNVPSNTIVAGNPARIIRSI